MKIQIQQSGSEREITVNGRRVGYVKRARKTQIYQPHFEGEVINNKNETFKICEIKSSDVKARVIEAFSS